MQLPILWILDVDLLVFLHLENKKVVAVDPLLDKYETNIAHLIQMTILV